MKRIVPLLLLMAMAISTRAKDPADSIKNEILQYLTLIDSTSKALHWEKGEVQLANCGASLRIPEGFKFLNADQSRFLLSNIWGNPYDASVLGMVFPDSSGIIGDSAWAYVVSFEKLGFVNDKDADKINYDDLMKEMKKSDKEENEQRRKLGLGTLEIVGWAQPPYYDKEHKVLHWAKELKTGEDTENTLNYDIRLLGRKGVLSLNAVASMSMLPEVKSHIGDVLAMARFDEGNRYEDFDSNTDEVAAWTIGGLVAGKILAKAGILAVLGKFFLAAWKFILLGVAAVWGAIRKFFSRKSETVTYDPSAPEEPSAN